MMTGDRYVWNPPRAPLTGIANKNGFGYVTILKRIPVILTKVIDQFYQHLQSLSDDEVASQEEAVDRGKLIIKDLSQLKYQIQHDKQLNLLQSTLSFLPSSVQDQELKDWNEFIKYFQQKNGSCSWLNAPWLFVECYFYRRIAEIFNTHGWTVKNDFDYFASQKQQSFQQHLTEMLQGIVTYQQLIESDLSHEDQCKHVLRASLWGNQADLSLHADMTKEEISSIKNNDIHQESNAFLISNDSPNVWKLLNKMKANQNDLIIHLVLDNAGNELFSDLLLADWLIRFGYSTKVIFHCKAYPWFVSDTTIKDFYWTLEQFQNLGAQNEINFNPRLLNEFAQTWQQYLKQGKWDLQDHHFWTSGFSFWHLSSAYPQLNNSLFKENSLIIFKGDLNYRKLTFDCQWEYPYNQPFEQNLQQVFKIKNTVILALRTCKSDTLLGLQDAVADQIDANEEQNGKSTKYGQQTASSWLVNGKYGVIQFCSNFEH